MNNNYLFFKLLNDAISNDNKRKMQNNAFITKIIEGLHNCDAGIFDNISYFKYISLFSN